MGPARAHDHAMLPFAVRLAANASWALVAITFIGLLGGTHPSDATRDRALLAASASVLALHVPVVAWGVRAIRSPSSRRAGVWALLASAIRIGAAALIFDSVHTISHEPPEGGEPRAGDAGQDERIRR